jgi:hypothetical protein
MPERLGHLPDGSRRRGRVPRRDVAADDRGLRRIDPGAEPLVDELEGRLDARAPGRDATDDLADGLDRLRVSLDRQLQPGGLLRLG